MWRKWPLKLAAAARYVRLRRSRHRGRIRMAVSVAGEEWPYDPRTILRRQLEKARVKGYEFKIGLELEYFLLHRTDDGGIEVADTLDTLEKPCYDLKGLTRNYDFLTTVSKYVN